ncbi:hypothetical protein K457DRAFT_244190 [Linnemannia elongata AG-77]|uniref:Uncharacterized protein n=1 Tax=Linnemannia elongata AG-77 TaxID=1314771 RepID=A0A197JDA1_9FUNG|nr:hypothetical protein K457DRAFT_244190 [Linnemannia elongata AG-77]
MNSSDIPRFLPSFLFSCCVCFCCVFPISIQEDCTAITFLHFLSFLSFFICIPFHYMLTHHHLFASYYSFAHHQRHNHSLPHPFSSCSLILHLHCFLAPLIVCFVSFDHQYSHGSFQTLACSTFFFSLFLPAWLQVLNLPTFSHAPTFSLFPSCLCNRVFASYSLFSVTFPPYTLHQRPSANESTLASPQSWVNLRPNLFHPLCYIFLLSCLILSCKESFSVPLSFTHSYSLSLSYLVFFSYSLHALFFPLSPSLFIFCFFFSSVVVLPFTSLFHPTHSSLSPSLFLFS